MKKKLLIAAILAAVVAVPVFAAAQTDNNNTNSRFVQMQQHHQQMLDQAVANGTITADEAEQLKQVEPIMQKIMQNGGMMGHGKMGQGMMKGMMGNNNPSERLAQMQQRHEQMIDQAVADGTITADEGAQLKQAQPIMAKIMQNGGMMGHGMMDRGGMMGNGKADCPNNAAPNNQQ